jgi:hypothetical protein
MKSPAAIAEKSKPPGAGGSSGTPERHRRAQADQRQCETVRTRPTFRDAYRLRRTASCRWSRLGRALLARPKIPAPLFFAKLGLVKNSCAVRRGSSEQSFAGSSKSSTASYIAASRRASVLPAHGLPPLGRRCTLPVQSAERLLHIGRIPDTFDGADSPEIGAAEREPLTAGRRRSSLAHSKEA